MKSAAASATVSTPGRPIEEVRTIGESSTEEIYSAYLRATELTPVSRQRVVADLAYLGVDQVLDDETYLLVRP